MSNTIKLCLMMTLVLLFCQIDGYAANRLLYENFDDQVLDSRLSVFGNSWNYLSPPEYNLTAVGRDGTGHCFSSGTIDAAYMCWRNNIPSPWPSNEMYVSFWMRYPKYTQTDPVNENLKIFYPHWDGADSYVHYSQCKPDLVYYSAKAKGTMVAYSKWLTCPNMTDGNWHHYEFYVNFSKGSSQFRYDGALKVDDTYGAGKWSNQVHYISMPSVNGRSVPSNPNPGDFTRQVDDLEVWDSLPGTVNNQQSSGPNPANPRGVAIRITG